MINKFPFRPSSEANRGRLIVALGVIILSPDALLVRLITADVWAIIWWRAALTFATILIILILRYRAKLFSNVSSALKFPGTLCSILWGCGTVFFVLAVSSTAVANVLVIIAAGPLFGAIMSQVILREKINSVTWAAVIVVFLGLAIVFGESLSIGNLYGDLCALVTALCSSMAFVLLRKAHNANPLILVGASSLFSAIIATPLAQPLTIDILDLQYLLVLSVLILPAAFSLIFIGPRYIQAPEIGILMLLEAILGPLWIWIVIGEAPTAKVVTAGILIISTLFIHSLILIQKK